MKEFRWNFEKNIELQRTRHVTFEALLDSRLIGMEDHAKKEHQRLMLFEYNRYVWVVPFVEDEDHYFLKTAFPSRKHTRKYLQGGDPS